jgi:hypothetical protein
MSCASAIQPAASMGGNLPGNSTGKAALARAKPLHASTGCHGVIKPWQPCHTQAEREAQGRERPAPAAGMTGDVARAVWGHEYANCRSVGISEATAARAASENLRRESIDAWLDSKRPGKRHSVPERPAPAPLGDCDYGVIEGRLVPLGDSEDWDC